MRIIFFLFTLYLTLSVHGQDFKLAQLKYNGGGDWYANPTSLRNLIRFCNAQLGTEMQEQYEHVDVGSADIFQYPILHMTGHGNVVFSAEEAENLRTYLQSGGFLHIDDNYGMDAFIRTEIKKVFPNKDWVEIPFDHPIYRQPYEFKKGLPKIHEHDDKPSQGLAIMEGDKILVFYTYESDLSDGWEDQQVHNDPDNIRQMALKMGANIVNYAFSAPGYKRSNQ